MIFMCVIFPFKKVHTFGVSFIIELLVLGSLVSAAIIYYFDCKNNSDIDTRLTLGDLFYFLYKISYKYEK